jgi:hypothetical protein
MTRRVLPLAGLAVLLAAPPAAAQPDLRKATVMDGLTLFPDRAQASRYYYAPGEMAIAETDGGRPEVTFLHVRYTGTAATGDRGRTVFRSVLTFRVRLAAPTAAELRDARARLRASSGRASIELRPLPVRRLDAALVFTPIDGEPDAPPTVIPEGHFEPDAERPAKPSEGYWRERTYTVGMEPRTAQVFSDALERGQVALSLGYALYADGIGPDVPLDELRGTPALVDALRERAPAGEARPHLVRAGAIGLTADARRWPALVRRLDINETVPPGYAALDIYCYDFNNDLRQDLYEKQVEIEAESVTGQPVRRLVAFQRDTPDLYARTLAFSVAVRLDRPYRYRLVEVARDGTSRAGPWQTAASWHDILDVTTRPLSAHLRRSR